jgi:hypothetical protein
MTQQTPKDISNAKQQTGKTNINIKQQTLNNNNKYGKQFALPKDTRLSCGGIESSLIALTS